MSAIEEYISYYLTHNILKPEEIEDFKETISGGLPICFRITQNDNQDITKLLFQQFSQYLQKIPYLSGTVYQCTLTKKQIKITPQAKELFDLLVNQEQFGNIQRQELVSMIPVQCLDIQANQSVLDLCAAPGSKSKQVLEILQNTGLLISNDLNFNRATMLAFQVEKYNTINTIVTVCDATKFPLIYKFDKVICDVPCSGDGTMRKNRNVRETWNFTQPMNLHLAQVQILEQALNLVKVGGSLVYSTCSMNPTEDEAVVAAMYHKYKEYIEIEEIGDKLPGLKYREGIRIVLFIKKGKIAIKFKGQTIWVDNYNQMQENYQQKLKKTPITLFNQLNNEDSQLLKRAIRIAPIDNNCGGFFICKIKIIKPIPLQNLPPMTQHLYNSDQDIYFKDIEYLYNQESVKSVLDQYKLQLNPIEYIKLGKGLVPTIFKINSFIKEYMDLMKQNLDLRIVHCGARIMVKSKDNLNDHLYRIIFEGLKHLKINKKLTQITKEEAVQLISQPEHPIQNLKHLFDIKCKDVEIIEIDEVHNEFKYIPIRVGKTICKIYMNKQNLNDMKIHLLHCI